MEVSTEQPDQPCILLYNLGQAGLIILCQSGVIYQNQTCGVACHQREAEGVFAPLDDKEPTATRSLLEEALANLGWRSVVGMTDEQALQFDAVLQAQAPGLSVDKEHLRDSEEAWVFVTVEPSEDAMYSGFGICNGILTWPNSD